MPVGASRGQRTVFRLLHILLQSAKILKGGGFTYFSQVYLLWVAGSAVHLGPVFDVAQLLEVGSQIQIHVISVAGLRRGPSFLHHTRRVCPVKFLR